MFTTIIIFIIILGILVFVHELGHFYTAKKLGLAPKEFGFGFPPRVGGVYKATDGRWHWVWGGKRPADAVDTVYSVNWLPLGGFVNIGEDEASGDDPRHFKNQKPWKRIVILSAGVAMNILVAAVFLAWGFMIGLPQTLVDVPAGARVSDRNIQILQVLPNTPAQRAGLQLGDIIIDIAGESFVSEAALQNYIADKQGVELNYRIKRGVEELVVPITPIALSEITAAELPAEPAVRLDSAGQAEAGKAGVGIAIAETGIVSFSWYRALWEGVKTTVIMTGFIVVAFIGLLNGLFAGAGVSADIAGPVGIAVMTGQVANLGFAYLLQFAAVLSINLAIINFLPFPALDGGRVFFVVLEKLRGKPVPERFETALHNAGFLLLMLLVLVVTYRDVLKFWQ